MAVAVSYRTSQSLQRKSATKGKVDVSAPPAVQNLTPERPSCL